MTTRVTNEAVMTAAALLAASVLTIGCGPTHIRAHTPRSRNYEPGEYERAAEAVSEGSLWQDSSRSLFADFRANRVGDLVSIRVDESPQASGESSTDMERESSMGFGVPNFFGFTQALTAAYPEIDPTKLVELMSSSSFSGTGDTQRGSRVRASIAVRVKQVLPNGDLFVEGTKIIMVNDEELHIYVSGVIRPQDIQQDNSISSALVADAQIEFTGRGPLTDNQQQGWLTRLLQAINPF